MTPHRAERLAGPKTGDSGRCHEGSRHTGWGKGRTWLKGTDQLTSYEPVVLQERQAQITRVGWDADGVGTWPGPGSGSGRVG